MVPLWWRLLAICSAGSASALLSATGQKTLNIPNGDRCTPAAETSFGVGFDLTASYGVGAVSFLNGTSIVTSKIKAANGFNDLLERLSLDSSRHPSPPYNNLGEVWDDMPRQYLRKARKAIGLPASNDVGILGKMLFGLRSEAERRLGRSIDSAAVSTVNLPALYKEDLQDAFEYVGLRYLDIPVHYDVLHETNAAYAGYGYGLCSNYTDRVACKQEQEEMPSDIVMAVLYTRTALTVSLSVMRSAYYLFEPDYRHLADFELGYDVRLAGGSSGMTYWEKLGSKLGQILTENPYYERPSKVLLLGDCVQDRAFVLVLEKVLRDQCEHMPEFLDEDSEWAAARGAAEFAKRIPYNPYVI